MKFLLVVGMLMAPIAANASTGPDVPAIVAQLRCTWLTLQPAVRGDFSQWVLPDFVPGAASARGRVSGLPAHPWSVAIPPPSGPKSIGPFGFDGICP